METPLIVAIAGIIGTLGWGLKSWIKHRLKIAHHKSSGRKFSEQLIYHRYVKTQLDKLRERFNAQACLAAKFHNGQYYIDGKHILKWSIVLDSNGRQFRENLQNRLTTDSPVFFGDLKENNLVFCKELEQLKCDGIRRLMESLKIKAFMVVLCGDSFVWIIYTKIPNQQSINKEQCELLRQECSTFAEYI
ncbi:MAG: hypothetical protein MK212_11910 [Saprospiraceae bacterium]|nr:hypothetical protein [Saprospiraceae bacterium]